jgi:hypothetical protein
MFRAFTFRARWAGAAFIARIAALVLRCVRET